MYDKTSCVSQVEASLKAALPHHRDTLCCKLSLAVAAAIETRTCNTAEIANAIPLKTENSEMRYQWFSRLLANEHVDPDDVMIP